MNLINIRNLSQSSHVFAIGYTSQWSYILYHTPATKRPYISLNSRRFRSQWNFRYFAWQDFAQKLATVFSSNVEGFTLLSQYLTLKKKYILKDKTKQNKTQVLDDLPDLQTKKLSALTIRREWLCNLSKFFTLCRNRRNFIYQFYRTPFPWQKRFCCWLFGREILWIFWQQFHSTPRVVF